MRHMIKIILLLGLCLNVVSAQQSSVGTISIFLLKDGIPLKGNEVLIDGKTKYLTDEDGATKLTLPTGKHLIEIVAKDTEGTNLGYSKKNVEIKTNRDTQVVASFSAKEKSPNIDIDVPVGKVLENTKKVDVAQGTGIINGRVISSEGKRAISGARIFVRGTSVDARTDANGRFSVKVPAGINLAISVVHSAYSAATVNGIKVQNGRTVSKSISLTPASMELEEFVVLAPKIEGSLSSVVQEEKKINAIANILGSEELSKKGDSSAAGALKRVAGITLVGNTVYVRGLGDRYSNVEMNGLPLPSPHPVKRTVPLDIFPSGVIKSIKVQKSATGDIPAGFGGGYIDIRTKDAVKENYLKVTLGAKGNTNTGDTVYTYQGSSSDWMGIDDGYRAIPAEILNQSAITVGEAVTSFDEAFGYTQEQLDQYMTEIVNRELKPKKWNLPFGGKLGIEGAYQTEIAPEQTINVFVNYNYDQDYRYREENYFSYAYNKEEDKLYSEPEQYGTVYRTTENYSHTAMFNLSYNYADVLHLKYTKLYTLHSESETRITDGIANSDDDWKIRYSLNWDERSMNIDQLSGDFKYRFLNYDNKLMFGMELAKAKLNQPGNYKYAYLRDIRFDGVVQGDPYLDRFSPNVFLNLTSDDDLNALYIKNKTDINIFSKKDTLEIGMSHSKKSRKSRYNKYQIDQGQGDKLTVNIDTIYDNNVRNNTDLFSVNIAFRPAYWYDAEVVENAVYLQCLLNPVDALEVNFGLRSVDFSQTLYEYTNNEDVLQPIEIKPNTLDLKKTLPNLSLKYTLNPKSQFDMAYSQTYIVPDLREFADAEFFHPYDVATVKGNPDLVNTTIDTFDLKYSYFFSDTEGMKAGAFYKKLNKPIEDVMLRSSSLPRYGFDNAKEATIYGFEFDGRKELSFVSDYLNGYFVSGNFTYANSDVTLRKEQEALYTTNHRQLQGLSKTILNLAFSYESDERSITFSYNKMGERIRRVGIIDGNDEFPDYYEVPPSLLDVVWIENFSDNLKAKLKLKNILDQETVWYQGSKSNITNRYKTGRSISFEASYKF